MTVAPDLRTRVSRNTEDIDALYKLLKKTNKRVTKIDRRVATIAAVQQEHGERLDSHSEKLDRHTEMLEEILGLLRQGR